MSELTWIVEWSSACATDEDGRMFEVHQYEDTEYTHWNVCPVKHEPVFLYFGIDKGKSNE